MLSLERTFNPEARQVRLYKAKYHITSHHIPRQITKYQLGKMFLNTTIKVEFLKLHM